MNGEVPNRPMRGWWRVGRLALAGLGMLLVGCAHLSPPYRTPGRGAGPAEREGAYRRHHIDLRAMVTPGGRRIWTLDRGEVEAQYYEASGDTTAAARVRQGRPWQRLGLGGFALGLGFCGAATQTQSPNAQPLLVGAVVGLALEVIGFQVDLWAYRKPAARLFNRYLQQDLGLDSQGRASPAAPVAPE